MIWTLYNLLILGAAISVALEAKQQRRSHRVQIALPALLHLPGGKLVRCQTVDFSEGGASLAVEPYLGAAVSLDGLAAETAVSVSLWRGEDEHQFPALVTATGGANVRVRWNLQTQEQEIALVQCTFSRADAWVSWDDGRPIDRPLHGLMEVLWVGLSGYRRMIDYAPASMTPALTALRRSFASLASLLPRHAALDLSAQHKK